MNQPSSMGTVADRPVVDGDQRAGCPSCGHDHPMDFLTVDQIAANVGSLCMSHDEALAASIGRITLTWCPRCHLIYNRTFDPALVHYDPGYDAALHHSDVFRTFIENLAHRLIDQFDLRGKDIVEIGCGSGFFLQRLCELGGNHGVGIDPCVSREGPLEVANGSVRLIRDRFTERYADLPCDFVCCLDVFEAIDNPRRLLGDVRKLIAGRPGAAAFFETPNTDYLLRQQATWSLYYEQYSHFTIESLSRLFENAGFAVRDAGPCHVDGQYLFIEAIAADAPQQSNDSPCHALPPELMTFADAHRRNVAEWTQRLESLRAQDRKVVAWGSGGKGVGFLNVLDTEQVISHVVDINQNKHGLFIPGSGQQIVAPDALRALRPDVIVITNAMYTQEIRRTVGEMGLDCRFEAI